MSYEEYITIEQLWGRNIPKHWTLVPLCSIANQKSICNCTELSLLSVYLDAGVIPFEKMGTKRANATSKDVSKYQRVDPGDFVLNNQQAWRGSVGVSDYIGIVSPAYIVLSMNDTLTPRYANYLMRSTFMVDQFYVASKGVGSIQRNIYWPELKRSIVCVPPQDEQDHIVRFLDWKVSSINKLIRIKSKQIAELEELKKICINDAVTGKTNFDTNTKGSGFDFIGKIPSHWKVVKMKWLLTTALQYGALSSGIEFNTSLPRYIRITDITIDNRLKEEGKLSLPREEAANYMLDNNDILFARSGATVGKSFLYKSEYGPSAFAGYLIRAKIDTNKAIPEFVYFVTLSKFYELWKNRIFIKATIQNISAERYNNLPIPLPQIEEQKKIVQFLKQKIYGIESIITKTARYIKELTDLKTRLIADTVTGKIDVRNVNIPDYEIVTDDTIDATEDDSEGMEE